MARERFTFKGLNPIENRLKRLADEVAYLTVTDRTDRNNEEMLGRFELKLTDALPYLQEPLPWAGDEDEDDRVDPYGELDEDEPGEEESEEQEEEESAARFAEAACRWLRDIAIRNTVGEPYRRFRVKAYGHKGVRTVDTGSFLCRNDGYDLDLPLGATSPQGEGEAMRIPAPTFEEVSNAGAAKGIQALGDYYAQWGRIVLGSVGQLQHVNNEMQARLHRQLQDSRGQVDELVAAILEYRVAQTQLADERRADERAGDARTVLAQTALQQLGDAARAFLSARGITPELSEVLAAIGQSPELVATLTDPDVRALMHDPGNMNALAQMLKAAGAQARAARQATAASTSDPGATAAG